MLHACKRRIYYSQVSPLFIDALYFAVRLIETSGLGELRCECSKRGGDGKGQIRNIKLIIRYAKSEVFSQIS